MRCDRVDFPPGAIAYRHVHPGPGIRRLLHGELRIEADDHAHTYGAGGAWFEDADYPVLATASAVDDTAFVRVMVLPAEWAGKRTVRYLDPADEAKPKLQRATVLLEEPIVYELASQRSPMPPDRAGRRATVSSVAHVSSGYARGWAGMVLVSHPPIAPRQRVVALKRALL